MMAKPSACLVLVTSLVAVLIVVLPNCCAAIDPGINTLSHIQIHRTLISMDGSATVSASPSLLGTNGSDTEWVTLEYYNPNATIDDWIAVFSPAKFNASKCPVVSGNEASPLLCTAPIKFQNANYTNPSYVQTGKGTLKFQIINQRSDFSFVLFAGGLSSPKLLAVSNTVTFKNPKAPVWPRLALGKSWDEMTVTWTSGYDVSEAYAVVEYGFKGGERIYAPAGTLTFGRDAMCGAPAKTVGWRDPGFIHTGFLKNLWPNALYSYRVGHLLLSSGQYVWSKNYAFKGSPYPGEKSVQRVVIFGDMGKAERDGSNEYVNTQPGALNTTDALIKDLANIDLVIHNGDITYANGYLSEWDQFTAQIEPIAANVPYMLSSGNHERDWPNSGSFYNGQDSGGECGVVTDSMFYFPSVNREQFWYSMDYGMFHFCVAHSEHDWREGTEQYKFLEKCMASVDRQKQPWLIFIAHRVLGYSSSTFYNTQGTFGEPFGRQYLQKLWQKYKVDLAFYGHVHNYERTCPVYEEQCTKSGVNHYSGVVNGTIHVVCGGGGRGLSDFAPMNTTWSLVKDKDYGFVKLTAYNHSSLLFEYKKSNTGKTFDSFTISREYMDTASCAIDSCKPITLAT